MKAADIIKLIDGQQFQKQLLLENSFHIIVDGSSSKEQLEWTSCFLHTLTLRFV